MERMKIRAYESITIAVDGHPTIQGQTLDEWKKILLKGIQRCVTIGRNLYAWDTYEETKEWVKVPGQPEHEVDSEAVQFTTYKHGGKLELQAQYFFEVNA
jgi:hypothetical protein